MFKHSNVYSFNQHLLVDFNNNLQIVINHNIANHHLCEVGGYTTINCVWSNIDIQECSNVEISHLFMH